jgi:hypothetical protein
MMGDVKLSDDMPVCCKEIPPIVIATFLLQSIRFAVTTRRNYARESGYTQKSSPHYERSF